jgi:death-on-curing protein
MRYLALTEVLDLHRRVMEQSGGATGLRDLGLLEAAIAQPRQAFGGVDLYPTLAAKAAALGFSIIQNHPFIDGNKRVGHAALEVMLLLNGAELNATVDEGEQIILAVASEHADRAVLTRWVEAHI